MPSIHFQLVTPQRVVLNDELVSLTCPTKLGEITILPGHMPLIAELTPGELIAKHNGGATSYLHVAGGFIEIKPHNQVVALADGAEHHHEIDIAEAEAARKRAQQILKDTSQSSEEYAMATAALERSLSRIHVARKHAHHRTAPITGQGVLED